MHKKRKSFIMLAFFSSKAYILGVGIALTALGFYFIRQQNGLVRTFGWVYLITGLACVLLAWI